MAHYTRLPSAESLSFDYSSAFTYESTAESKAQKYASPFTYNRTGSSLSTPIDIHIERGLKHKSFLTKAVHWTTIVLYAAILLITLPISIWFIFKRVKDSQQVVVSRLGMVKCIKGPAVIFVMPYMDSVKWYDTSLKAFNVPPQKMMTVDGLVVELGAVVRYKLTDAEKVFFAAQNIDHILRSTAQTVTSKYITKIEEKLLTDTASINRINADIKYELQQVYLQWGVAVNSFEITGLKAIVRIQQQDAIQDVIEPLKQWFFGGHTDDSQSGQTFSMMSAFTGQQAAPTSQQTAALHTNGGQSMSAAGSASSLSALRHKLTPNDLLTAVKTICNRDLCERIDTIYKFIVPDHEPSVYFMDLKNGEGDCGPGEPPAGRADTIVTVSLANMQLMFTGDLKPFNAYMSGALSIDGDISGAMKLDGLVSSIAALTGSPSA